MIDDKTLLCELDPPGRYWNAFGRKEINTVGELKEAIRTHKLLETRYGIGFYGNGISNRRLGKKSMAWAIEIAELAGLDVEKYTIRSRHAPATKAEYEARINSKIDELTRLLSEYKQMRTRDD